MQGGQPIGKPSIFLYGLYTDYPTLYKYKPLADNPQVDFPHIVLYYLFKR